MSSFPIQYRLLHMRYIIFILFFFSFYLHIRTFVYLHLFNELHWIVNCYYGSHCKCILPFCCFFTSNSLLLLEKKGLGKMLIKLIKNEKWKRKEKNILITLLPNFVELLFLYVFSETIPIIIDINVDFQIIIIMWSNSIVAKWKRNPVWTSTRTCGFTV